MNEVRVRIAPSPSGYLHVGTARTAVFNWLFARHNQGKFILRIEDTDASRSGAEMVTSILESLKWLGLFWDEGPYFQSQRLDLYKKKALELYEKKKAYWCYCTPQELEAKRNLARAQKIAWKYDRRCLKLSDEGIKQFETEKRPKALRILVPEGNTVYIDLVYGELQKENKDIEDFVILRSDDRGTYNFACVVDDSDMKISHIIRGNDHISNTFKQVLIYQALEEKTPRFAHLPLNLGMDRQKISKRKGAVALTDYKEDGYLPEALLNFLALLGWSPKDGREILSKEELISLFSLENVNPANPVFDEQKLEWMNGEYIKKTDNNTLLKMLRPFLVEAGYFTEAEIEQKHEFLLKIIPLIKERARKLKDLAETGKFFFAFDYRYDPQAKEKLFSSPKTGENLKSLLQEFKKLPDLSKEKAEPALRVLAEKLSIKPAEIIHPTRLALTGLTIGPGLFDIIEVLGKQEVIKRLQKAVDFISKEN